MANTIKNEIQFMLDEEYEDWKIKYRSRIRKIYRKINIIILIKTSIGIKNK